MDSLKEEGLEAEGVWRAVRRTAEVSPWAPALIEPGGTWWDFGTLARLMDELGGLLSGLGLGANDTVAVLLPDGACGLVTLLGVTSVCGCAPLNTALTEAELRTDLNELGVRAIVCLSSFELGHRLGEELGLTVIHARQQEFGCVWEFVRAGREGVGQNNDGAVLLMHTSATTGRRKVVPLSRGNLAAGGCNSIRTLELGTEDRVLVMTRLFHAQGILSATAQWQAGGGVIATRGLEPGTFRSRIAELKPTWYTCGPTLHRTILLELQQRPLDQPCSLRFVRSGGNRLAPELRHDLEAALGIPVLDMYGLSETGAVAASVPGDRQAVGWRCMGPEVAIMDAVGRRLEPGEDGEIVVRGRTVMAGYLRDEEANREAFWGTGKDAWFRTGDLGRLDAEGFLTMSGRLKEMINRGGQKVNPGEVDAVLIRHPAVRMAAAFGVPHAGLGEDVACAVVLREGMQVSEAELRAFARKTLARFKLPRRVVFVTEIPYGATGKPKRLVLRDKLVESTGSGARPGAGRAEIGLETGHRLNDVDGMLEEIWVRRLKCSEAWPHDDFFELGGDSLEAESMLAEVEEVFEVKFGPEASERFFDNPTLGTLAELVATPVAPEKVRSHEIGLHWLRGDGPGLEIFLFPADGDEGLYFRMLSRVMGRDRRMALVRPESSWHERGLNVIEVAAARAVEVIRNARPAGPYLLGGFCMGGAVAFETARRLEEAGERALLVLIDSPMPGEPHFAYQWTLYAGYLGSLARKSFKSGRWRPVASFLRWWMRRLAWLAIRRSAERRGLLARSSVGKWMQDQALISYLPTYRARRVRAPILHFSESEDKAMHRSLSREAWGRFTGGGQTMVELPGRHNRLFTEENLSVITDAVTAWVEREMPGADQASDECGVLHCGVTGA